MDCLFSVLTMSFQEKFFILRKSNLSISIIFFYGLFGSSQNSLPNPRQTNCLLISSRGFRVLGFIVMSMMHLSWFLYKMWYNGLNCFVYFTEYRYPIVPASLTEKTIFLPLNCLCTFFENQLSIFGYISGLSPFGPIYYLSLYQYYTVLVIVAL